MREDFAKIVEGIDIKEMSVGIIALCTVVSITWSWTYCITIRLDVKIFTVYDFLSLPFTVSPYILIFSFFLMLSALFSMSRFGYIGQIIFLLGFIIIGLIIYIFWKVSLFDNLFSILVSGLFVWLGFQRDWITSRNKFFIIVFPMSAFFSVSSAYNTANHDLSDDARYQVLTDNKDDQKRVFILMEPLYNGVIIHEKGVKDLCFLPWAHVYKVVINSAL